MPLLPDDVQANLRGTGALPVGGVLEGTRPPLARQAQGQGKAKGIVKRKPLYERAEKVGRELGRGLHDMLRRLNASRSVTTDDLECWLRSAWRRGYAAGRRDEKRRRE